VSGHIKGDLIKLDNFLLQPIYDSFM